MTKKHNNIIFGISFFRC